MNAHVSTATLEDGAVSFVAEEATALAVLTDREKAEAFFERVKAEVEAFVPDVTTAKGRDEIKSLAFKVTKTKTAVDAARKKLTEDARKQVDTANAAGRVIWDKLEALAANVRKPLTDWEQAEKDRIEAIANTMAAIEWAATAQVEDTAEGVVGRILQLEAMTFDADVFGDSLERAQTARDQAVVALGTLHVRLIGEEADRAELARLRRENEERLAAEQAEREAKEAADAEAARLAQAKADEDARAEREAEVRSLAAANAAEEARLAAERQAQAALDEQARLHQAELDRLQKVADDKDAAEKVEADLAAQREKNRAHVSKIMAAAKLAIMGLGVTEDQAREVVKAIKAGSVPNISIQF